MKRIRIGELDGKTQFSEGRINRQEHNDFWGEMTLKTPLF